MEHTNIVYSNKEGYGLPWVWYHKVVYNGQAYRIADLNLLSGDLLFYDTMYDFENGKLSNYTKIHLKVINRRVEYQRGWVHEFPFGELEASKIQRAWKRAISDPAYQMCRDRLMREAGEFVF
jgi:hypothetical protein